MVSKSKKGKSLHKKGKKSKLIHKKKKVKKSKKIILKGGHKKTHKTRPKKHRVNFKQKGGSNYFKTSNVMLSWYGTNTYHTAKPYLLNQAVLQYLVDNNKLYFNQTLQGNNFMGIEDFPSILLEEKPDKQNTSVNNPNFEALNFVDIYEDGNTSNEQHDSYLYDFKKDGKIKIKVKVKKDDQDLNLERDVSYLKAICDRLNNPDSPPLKEGEQCEEYKELKIEEKLAQTYKIIYYPEPNIMNHIKSKIKEEEFKKTLTDYSNNIVARLCGLYLAKDNTGMDANVDTNMDTVLQTLLSRDTQSEFEYHIKPFLEELNDENVKQFEDKMEEIIKSNNSKYKPLLQCANLKIQYIYVPLKKYVTDDQPYWAPMVFNMKDLGEEKIHKTLLIAIKTHINEKLYNEVVEGEISSSNFYAYCTFGNMFMINAHYVHPLDNEFNFSYMNKKMMTLEELIYCCNLKNNDGSNSFLSQVRFDYQVKPFELTSPEPKQNKLSPKQINGESISGSIMLPRQNISSNELFLKKGDKIILCHTTKWGTVEIYYESAGKYYYMKLQARLQKIDIQIVKEKEKTVYECNKQIMKVADLPKTQPLYNIEISGTLVNTDAVKDKLNLLFSYLPMFSHNKLELTSVNSPYKDIIPKNFYNYYIKLINNLMQIYNDTKKRKTTKISEECVKVGPELKECIRNLCKNLKLYKIIDSKSTAKLLKKKKKVPGDTLTLLDNYIIFIAYEVIGSNNQGNICKYVIWLVPKELSEKDLELQKYLFDNETPSKKLNSISSITDYNILEKLKNILIADEIYKPDNDDMFMHFHSWLPLLHLHLHIVPKQDYKSGYRNMDVYIPDDISSKFITNAINFLKTNGDYFKNLKSEYRYLRIPFTEGNPY